MDEVKRLISWQDGYRAGLGLDFDVSEECPMPETDDELLEAWRHGWVEGTKYRKEMCGA